MWENLEEAYKFFKKEVNTVQKGSLRYIIDWKTVSSKSQQKFCNFEILYPVKYFTEILRNLNSMSIPPLAPD